MLADVISSNRAPSLLYLLQGCLYRHSQAPTSTQSSDEPSLLKRIGPEITPDDASSRPTKLRKLNQDDSRSPDHAGSVDHSFTPAAWHRTMLPTPPPSSSHFSTFSRPSGMQHFSPDIGIPTIPGSSASMVNTEFRQQPTAAKTGLGDLLAENTRLKRTNDTYAREVQMHEEHIQTLQGQVSQIPELHAQIRTLEHDSDVLQRELDSACNRAADLDVARRESTEQLSALREENRRLAAQVASLEAQASRIPMLERDVQSRTDRLHDMNARLDAGDDEQRSILAQLRRSLGDQNGFWDDAPLSMVLLAIESELHKLRSTSRRALLAEEDAAILRARAKALESMDPTVLPSMVEALAQIASLTSGLVEVPYS
ncbi:hypothetical protein PENSPDRAFT_17108 [Peniophora sp. CONT]|nr:hypothetical protein PENSPDRAFT_17108 [Peniophora sp. CONT]